MASLNQDIISRIPLLLPPIETQRQIAGILSAYDDLIENNTRRIKILEEMAQSLYREWFVHFRYPGHEHVPIVESPAGLIPEGWEVKYVPDVIDINPRTPVPREGEKPYVPMGSISTTSMVIDNIETRTGNSGAKFKNGDTLFARITPSLENGKTGYVQFLPSNSCAAFGSTEFIVLRSKSLSPEFVYLLARSDEFRDNAIKSMSGASGRQRVQESCFEDYSVIHPPDYVLDNFQRTVEPVFSLVQALHEKNAVLTDARNLLLPRLISGHIPVSRNRQEEGVLV